MVEVCRDPRHPAPVATTSLRIRENFRILVVTFGLTSLLPLTACTKGKTKPEEQKPDAAPAETGTRIPAPGAIQHVPVGTLSAGSWPGESGRDPSLELAPVQVELGPFRIDAYPYPGLPDQAPRLDATVTEATALCAARKGRLCTELEWERACRGPESAVYPSGALPCDKASSKECLSGFDISMMGSIPEWTKSQFGRDSEQQGKSVVRGAGEVPSAERRCARRRAPAKDESVGFRCCYGAPNAASLKEPSLGPAYKEVDLTSDDLKKLLLTDEKTKPLAKDLQLFKPETALTVLSRGPGETKGFTLTTRALQWQPARGSQLLVVAARSGKNTSFVLAYFMNGQKNSLAGSFIMKNESGPIALAYAESIRPRLHFSSCWGCPGETGKVLFRDPEELVFLQP